MAERTIWVQAANMDRRIVVQEVNPAHPNGEIWIAGDERVHEVAQTPEINQALAAKTLVQVDAPRGESSRRPSKQSLADWPQLAAGSYKDAAAVSAASDEDLLRIVDQATLDAVRKVAPAKAS